MRVCVCLLDLDKFSFSICVCVCGCVFMSVCVCVIVIMLLHIVICAVVFANFLGSLNLPITHTHTDRNIHTLSYKQLTHTHVYSNLSAP